MPEMFAYCQACRFYIPITISAGVDALFGLVQVHTCAQCGRTVCAVRRDAAEVMPPG